MRSALSEHLGVGRGLPRPYCARVLRSGRFLSVEPRSDRLRTNKSRFSKPLLTQAVIAIENVRLFKEIEKRNAEFARHWSIRPRQPRCSASSAARPLTCSQSSMRSSGAPAGLWD